MLGILPSLQTDPFSCFLCSLSCLTLSVREEIPGEFDLKTKCIPYIYTQSSCCKMELKEVEVENWSQESQI